MFKIARTLALVLALCSFAACSHGKTKTVSGPSIANNEANGNGVQLEMGWVKVKGKSMDMKITLDNKYTHWVVLARPGWKLVFNGKEGELTKFNFMDELGDGATSTNIISFRFAEKQIPSGHGVLTIDPIFSEDAENGAHRTPVSPLKFEFDI